MDERGYAVNVENLLKRAEIFLSEGKFKKADEYCERVLDEDVRCARAYLLKVAAEFRFISVDFILIRFSDEIHNNVNFKKAYQYGDKEVRDFIQRCEDSGCVAQTDRATDSDGLSKLTVVDASDVNANVEKCGEEDVNSYGREQIENNVVNLAIMSEKLDELKYLLPNFKFYLGWHVVSIILYFFYL